MTGTRPLLRPTRLVLSQTVETAAITQYRSLFLRGAEYYTRVYIRTCMSARAVDVQIKDTVLLHALGSYCEHYRGVDRHQ